ncbi:MULTISPECIES: hypothetical protein [Sphingomonas]|jgi:hypothetical protein|uniref:hypothetical protein n=1 Tax=Sphingomonas TaxID=13687 RepID=UPI000AC84F5A|nr:MULTISPECIES: hypothetical protein [unclassified Sphingomonas]MDY1008665.1 hypothetical protein [Sphingomonas sp. CFBP9019]
MTHMLLAGLALATAAAMAAPTIEHTTRVDHHSGPVEVRYRGAVVIEHRQIGAVAPAGQSSTLRCAWTANMIVDRHAKASSGTLMTRNFARDGVAAGHQPGWCSSSRAAIAREVAAKTRDLHQDVTAMAQEDHDVLRAELDQIHGALAAG